MSDGPMRMAAVNQRKNCGTDSRMIHRRLNWMNLMGQNLQAIQQTR